MKRYFACLIVPLLVVMLSSFTPPSVQEHHVRGSDSTVVSIHFDTVRTNVVVKDNRTTAGMTTVIDKNSESNHAVAKSISNVAEAMIMAEQERRCVSVMDRITTQTGLTIDEANIIIHKKKVYDMIFYTLFSIYLLYFMYAIVSWTRNTNVISMKEWTVKLVSSIMWLLVLYLLYISIDAIVNGAYYPTIHNILNTAPG